MKRGVCSRGCVRSVAVCADPVAKSLGHRRAADHDFDLVADALPLCFCDNSAHLVHGRGEQRGAADEIRMVFDSGSDKGLGRDIDAEVDNGNALSFEHHFDKVFADIMQVAFDSTDHSGAF